MSSLLQKAVTSLRLGIEDFQTGEDDRLISFAWIYYAGLLLLVNECLVRAAPRADPMQVIKAIVKPISDCAGGVTAAPDGRITIGFHDLKNGFLTSVCRGRMAIFKSWRECETDLSTITSKSRCGSC